MPFSEVIPELGIPNWLSLSCYPLYTLYILPGKYMSIQWQENSLNCEEHRFSALASIAREREQVGHFT